MVLTIKNLYSIRLNIRFDTVYGVADGNVAILGSGNSLYFVSLKGA